MTWDVAQFNQLADTEEYFQFFHVPYDTKVVNVNRLHILKLFSKYMGQIDANLPELEPQEKLEQYREALKQAYEVFTTSTAQEQKLFKVFNQKPQNVVTLGQIGSV